MLMSAGERIIHIRMNRVIAGIIRYILGKER